MPDQNAHDRRSPAHDAEVDERVHTATTPHVVRLATALGLVAVLGVGGTIAVSATANLDDARRHPEARSVDSTIGGSEGSDGGDGSPGKARPNASGAARGPHSSAGAGSIGSASDDPGAGSGDGGDGTADGESDPSASQGSEPASETVVFDAASDLAEVPRPPADWSSTALADAERWLEQQGVIADCMLDEGFDYDFVPYWLGGAADGRPPGAAVRTDRAWVRALDGEAGRGQGRGPGQAGGDWRDRGCRGYAEHVID